MNWEAIGAVGEIAGATAVVLSLIYLAIQGRQNSNMARAESRLRLVDTWREFSNSLESGDVYAFGRGLQHYPGERKNILKKLSPSLSSTFQFIFEK